MIAPAMFPQLGLLEESILMTLGVTIDDDELPAGLYEFTYGGGGGGGAYQYFGHTWEQRAGNSGATATETAYITHKAQLMDDYRIGDGGSVSSNGSSTLPLPDMSSASGGAGSVVSENGPAPSGSSVPSATSSQTGIRSFCRPELFTSGNRSRGGKGYHVSTGAAQSGLSGYIKLRKISQ